MAISEKAPFCAPTAAEVEAAHVAGAVSQDQEPHAAAITFDPSTRRFTLVLTNGTAVSFDAAMLRELQAATDDQMGQVLVAGHGSTLEWPVLDMHISVGGLVVDLFGGESWHKALRAELSRRLARSGSEARTQASRQNGKKGGRPKKHSA